MHLAGFQAGPTIGHHYTDRPHISRGKIIITLRQGKTMPRRCKTLISDTSVQENTWPGHHEMAKRSFPPTWACKMDTNSITLWPTFALHVDGSDHLCCHRSGKRIMLSHRTDLGARNVAIGIIDKSQKSLGEKELWRKRVRKKYFIILFLGMYRGFGAEWRPAGRPSENCEWQVLWKRCLPWRFRRERKELPPIGGNLHFHVEAC